MPGPIRGERLYPIEIEQVKMADLIRAIPASKEFEERKDQKGSNFDIGWTPNSGFILVLTTQVKDVVEQAKFEFSPGELPPDLIKALSVLRFDDINKSDRSSDPILPSVVSAGDPEPGHC